MLVVGRQEQEYVVRVVTSMTLQPMSETPVIFNTIASGIVQLDSYTPFGQQYPCKAAREIMDLIPRKSFRFLIDNASTSAVNLAKHQRAATRYPVPLATMQNTNE